MKVEFTDPAYLYTCISCGKEAKYTISFPSRGINICPECKIKLTQLLTHPAGG